MTAALLWLRAHKQFAMVAGAILAVFTSGYCAGKRSVAKPAVHEVVQEHAKADTAAVVQQTVHAGPERITVTDYDVGPWAPSRPSSQSPSEGGTSFPSKKEEPASEPYTAFCRPIVTPGQDRIIRRTVIERGPSVTETHAQAEVHEVVERKLDLTVSPAAAPQWAVQVGAEDVLQARTLRLAVRRRIIGPFGLEVSVQPAQRSLGAAVWAEW